MAMAMAMVHPDDISFPTLTIIFKDNLFVFIGYG